MLITLGILTLAVLMIRFCFRWCINFIGLAMLLAKIFLGLLIIGLPLITFWAWIMCWI